MCILEKFFEFFQFVALYTHMCHKFWKVKILTVRKNAKISQNIEKNCEKVVETLCNLPKTLQGIPADGLERFWDIMGVKNIFYLHFSFKITVFESFWLKYSDLEEKM